MKEKTWHGIEVEKRGVFATLVKEGEVWGMIKRKEQCTGKWINIKGGGGSRKRKSGWKYKEHSGRHQFSQSRRAY